MRVSLALLPSYRRLESVSDLYHYSDVVLSVTSKLNMDHSSYMKYGYAASFTE